MSTGVRIAVIVPMSPIRIAITMKVSGRASAMRTIPFNSRFSVLAALHGRRWGGRRGMLAAPVEALLQLRKRTCFSTVSNIVCGMIDMYWILIMELRHLRYFVGVAEERHFARAAARLGISQPPLSQQIKALEEELGVRLLERTSRSVSLTPAGEAFLAAARATLAQADAAITIARRAAQGEIGSLSIGFNASAPFVPRVALAIHNFRARYPEVQLTLSETVAAQQISAIEQGALDIGIMRSRHEPDLPEALAHELLLDEQLMVAMRADHRLARRASLRLRDLKGEPMLLYAIERTSGFTHELVEMFRRAGVEPRVAQTVREVTTLFGLAAAGVGITILAESMCALHAADLVYLPLEDREARTSLWLIYLNEGTTPASRRFLDMILREGVAAPAALPKP
jgi:DNA-binding transcriptional LysR family regulator